MKHKWPLLGAGLALCWATNAQATSDALLNKLVQKGVLTQQEANQLREDLDKEDAQSVELYNKTKIASWIDELKWSGDMRLRAEFFDNEDQTSKIDRWRYRLRARLGLEAKFVDWAKIGLRLASGGEDPVSTNQSFQDTFSRKEFRIDLAYVTLTPPWCDIVSVTGGKMNNPIWQPPFSSPLQYDFDVTPEGIAEQINWKFGENKRHRLFANFGQFVLDEVSADSDDPYMLEFQTGGELRFGEDPKSPLLRATLAAGYSQTFNTHLLGVASGSQPAGSATPAAQSTSPNRGNATRQPGGAGTTLFYLDDFRVVNGRAEVAWQVSKRPFLRTPAIVTASGEYSVNLTEHYDTLSGANSTQTKNPDATDGWSLQLAFGGNRKQGEWQIAYQYKYVEADAVWDALTDSDWGLGGTDREGHVVNATYNVREWWQLGVKALITDKISSRANSAQNTRGNDTDEHLLRVQLDTVFKF